MQRTGVAIWGFLALSGLGIGCFSVLDTLYFHDKGYSAAVIGGLVGTFNVSVAIAEIPAAVIFDRRSHWLAIQLGNLIRTGALILFFLSMGLIEDLVAEALAGVGAAAMSGTSNALVLNRLGDAPGDQRRALARIAWLGSGTSLAGGLLGVYLFTQQPRAIWLGGAVCMLAAGAVLFLGRGSTGSWSGENAEPLRRYVRGLAELGAHPRAWMSVFAAAALIGPLILWQLRLGGSSLTAILLGFAVMKAGGVIGGRLMGGRRIPQWALPVLIAVNVLAISVFALSEVAAVIIVGFAVHVVTHVAVSVYCAARFHEVVPATRRAGASSVVSLLGSGLTAAAALAVGYMADAISPFAAMWPSFVLYGLVLAIGGASAYRSKARARRDDEQRMTTEQRLLD